MIQRGELVSNNRIFYIKIIVVWEIHIRISTRYQDEKNIAQKVS